MGFFVALLNSFLQRLGVSKLELLSFFVSSGIFFVSLKWLSEPQRNHATLVQVLEAQPPSLLICVKCGKKSKDEPCPENLSSTATDTPTHKPISSGQYLYEMVCRHPTFDSLQKEKKLEILPVRCLSHCDTPNCIALQHPTRFNYHFGEVDTADIEDLIQFTDFYIKDEKVNNYGFSKSKMRPGVLRRCLTRLPPTCGPGKHFLNPEKVDSQIKNNGILQIDIPGTYTT